MSLKSEVQIEKYIWEKSEYMVKNNLLLQAIPEISKHLTFTEREVPRSKEPYMPMPPAQVIISTEFTIITPQSKQSILELLEKLQNKLPLSAIADYQIISTKIKDLL